MPVAGGGQVDSVLKDLYEITKTMSFEQTREAFNNAKKQQLALREISMEDFSLFCMQQTALEDERDRRTSTTLSSPNPYPSIAELISMPIAAPIGTANELWNAVCALEPDPIRLPPAAAPIPTILELLRRERFEHIPLGMLELKDSVRLCALEPGLCLPPDEDAYDPVMPTQRHLTNGHSVKNAVRAIKYADSHPSEASVYLSTAQDQKAKRKTDPTLAANDELLRRFMPLGYVSMKIRGEWVKTGFVLVIDVSYGRKCHPWFVLAAEFETDDEGHFFNHGSYVVEVPKEVPINDSEAIGVLPGNSNRTTIAKLEHCDDTRRRNEKFVSHFGENFRFKFKRMGQDFNRVRSPRGPDRAHIMDWWWDPKEKVEVCFTPTGQPYIRYNPQTREYDGPKDGILDEMGNILGTVPPPVQESQSSDYKLRPGPSGSGSSRGPGQNRGLT